MTSELEAAERAVALQPEDAGLWYRLGLARLDSGLLEKSEDCWRKVLALDPRHARASVNLGLVMQHAGRADEALEQYRHATAADPSLAQGWFNLGALLLERDRPREALEPLRTAVRLEPASAQWHAALGSALRISGSPRDAIVSLRAALERDPSLQGTHSELLELLSRLPGETPRHLYDAHLEWARRHAGEGARDHPNVPDSRRRLRLGYVSRDFTRPAIASCLQPVLAWHDPSQFEVLCYSDAFAEDPVSWRLRARGVKWRTTAAVNDEAFAAGIREDGIDLLVDLDGHAGRRMPVFARKPAPVQASWLGYPCTTGLRAIDYRLANAHLLRPGAEQVHAERLVRLPGSDGERLARELETAYRQMWQTWCAREAPRSFDVAPATVPPRSAVAGPVRAGAPARVVLDGVFFQDFGTGISRVWQMLLGEWVTSGFAEQVVLLDRQDTAPRIPGIRRRVVPRHAYERLDEDRALLQRICDEERATVFASTYFSSPLTTPSVLMVYDMIPEVFGSDLDVPMWREKDASIRRARRFVAISSSTARDLCGFYPEIDPGRVTVAHCGVSPVFRPAEPASIDGFRNRHGISRPYFLLVGSRVTYKNTITFLRVFSRFRERGRLAVVCVGGEKTLEPELAALREGSERHMLRLDDEEMRLAYAGAVALAYPSAYEGFGMPVAEAMACGCPVITTGMASLPEVAGEAAIYVKPMDEAALDAALRRVQDPTVRAELAAKGVEQARRYSWATMAKTVAGVLTETAA